MLGLVWLKLLGGLGDLVRCLCNGDWRGFMKGGDVESWRFP